MATSYVLTLVPGTVTCGHGPGIVALTSNAKLCVNSQPVLLEGSVVNQSVSGCSTIAASDSNGPTDAPCSSATSITGGKSTKLLVGKKAVLLDSLGGTTNGMVAKVTPQTLLAGKTTQTRLAAT